MKNCFVILQGSLPQGSTSVKWEADGKFFEEYGSPSIRGAKISINALAVKKDASIRIELEMKGEVTVPCDRCLEDMTLEVECAVTAGTQKDRSNEKEEMETLEVEDGQIILDQLIYDSVMVSIPIVHCHEEGKCNPEVLKKLESKPSGTTSPFAELSEMLGKRKKK